MTNEQRNQVAAMNASGMSIDEIIIDTGLDKEEVEAFVAERNEKKGKRAVVTTKLRQAIIEWYQSGYSEAKTARKFGVSQSTVHRIVTEAKEKEPAAAATATDSDVKTLQVQDSTVSAECQALCGVNVLGVLECALDNAYGSDAEIMSLRADSDTASIVFRYGGTTYSVQFGLAF